MLGLGNPEIAAVRKHFSTREIVLFLLFPCCLYRRQKRNKPPALMSLLLFFSKGVTRGEFSLLCERFGLLIAMHLLSIGAGTDIYCVAGLQDQPNFLHHKLGKLRLVHSAGRGLQGSGSPPEKMCQNPSPCLWMCHCECIGLPAELVWCRAATLPERLHYTRHGCDGTGCCCLWLRFELWIWGKLALRSLPTPNVLWFYNMSYAWVMGASWGC